MAGTESGSQDFLWVNKNIHSLALSNNRDDPARIRSINKHVQRHRARSSATRKPALDSKAPLVVGWRLHDASKQGKRPRRESATMVTQASNDAEQDQANFSLSSLFADIPPSYGSPIDPFRSSSVPITGEVFGFLRHFTDCFLAAAIQTQVQNVLSPGKPPSSAHAASKKIVRACVADARHMYSVLTLTSYQIKYLIGHKLTRRDIPEFYMAKALAGLRRSLASDEEVNALGQQALLDLTWMGTAEAYVENFTGALAHFRISLYVAEKLGGFKKIDPFVRELCRIGDIFISSLTLTPPLFDLAGDPGPISMHFHAMIDRRILPQRRMGAAFLEQEGLWDSATAAVVHDMIDVVQAAQFLWVFPDADVTSDDRDWVLQRSHALTHKLLSMVPTEPAANFHAAIQECCRLGFVLWLFYVLAGTAGVPSEPGSLKRVRNIMPEHTRRLIKAVELADALDTYDTRWGPYEELLLWVLAFGTLSFKGEKCWFAVHLSAECEKRGIYTYDALAIVTSRYLSLDRLEQLSNRKLARTLISGLMAG